MLLAVLLGAALEDIIAAGKRGGRVAHDKLLWRNDKTLVRSRDTRVGHGRERLYVGCYLSCGLASKLLARGDDDRDGLSGKMDLAVRQQRLVRHDAADLVLADQIFGGD